MPQMITVVNRTMGKDKRALHATFDGEDYEIPPGESMLDAKVFPYAARQNPVMGSMDPHDPVRSLQYLIGRKDLESRYPCTPVKENPDAIELVNRSKMPGVAHRIQGHTASPWELRTENPSVAGTVVGGD